MRKLSETTQGIHPVFNTPYLRSISFSPDVATEAPTYVFYGRMNYMHKYRYEPCFMDDFGTSTKIDFDLLRIFLNNVLAMPTLLERQQTYLGH